MGHHAEATSGVCWRLAGNKDPLLSLGILWLLATELPLTGNDVWPVVVGPERPDRAGRLGQADPDPHAGVGHKGAVVPHPGACVSPILLKRHIPDALAKVSEDVGDLRGEGKRDGEDLWILPPPTGQILPQIK